MLGGGEDSTEPLAAELQLTSLRGTLLQQIVSGSVMLFSIGIIN